ncbi:hypothetical protein ACJJTC_012154 [Scirpophaga incertulas]
MVNFHEPPPARSLINVPAGTSDASFSMLHTLMERIQNTIQLNRYTHTEGFAVVEFHHIYKGARARGRADVRGVSSRNIKNAFKFRAIKNTRREVLQRRGTEDASDVQPVHLKTTQFLSTPNFAQPYVLLSTMRRALCHNERNRGYSMRIALFLAIASLCRVSLRVDRLGFSWRCLSLATMKSHVSQGSGGVQ